MSFTEYILNTNMWTLSCVFAYFYGCYSFSEGSCSQKWCCV